MAAPLRLGLIGAGRWGRNYIKTIAGLEGMCLAALASGNPGSAHLVPGACLISPDWQAILDRRLIDAVIIATPPAVHARMATAAVERGLPVLVEKPLTLDSAEAVALRKFVAEHKGLVMVGHTQLFHPAYRKLREMLADYGPVRAIRSEAGNYGPFRLDTPVTWDWGAHDVAMCLDLLGTSPQRTGLRLVERRAVENALGEIFDIELIFPGEVRAAIRIGNILPKRRRFTAYTETAALIYDDFAPHKLTIAPGTSDDDMTASRIPVPLVEELPLSNAVRTFARAVETGATGLDSLDLGVSVVSILAQLVEESDPGKFRI